MFGSALMEGLFCFDRQRGKFISFAKPVANTQLVIPTARVTSLYKTSQADLWIGTDGDGAYHYNLQPIPSLITVKVTWLYLIIQCVRF